MDAEQVTLVLDALGGRGVRCWVAGGWGVDALVGRQTREHHATSTWRSTPRTSARRSTC